jgi:hypothetical protein
MTAFMDGYEGLILGEFKLLTRIGTGAMGTVYLAQQPSLKRSVAVKILLPALATDVECARRFKREAMLAASLNDPNIVQVHAAGEEQGLHYLVMEYVHGESLEKRITREGRILPEATLKIIIQMAQALDHAWRKAGMIHRDVKPSNILLSSKGDVKLADFGLAKSSGGDSTLTCTGMFVGTPRYISPEQARGDDKVDFTADIYSLGCTLYHMLCGRAPFVADAPIAVVVQHLTKPLPSILEKVPDCPPAIVKLINHMTAKDPAKRPATYAELLTELHAAEESLTKPRKNHAWRYALGALLVLLAGAWGVESRIHRPTAHLATPTPVVTKVVEATPNPDAPLTPAQLLAETGRLPAEDRVKRVLAEIKKLNPGFEAESATYVVEENAVVELSINTVGVTDISPISALVTLSRLHLGGRRQQSALSDLRPLKDLKLELLECRKTAVSDLQPLHEMPLRKVLVPGSPVIDLGPLRGRQLQAVDISETHVSDLAPLEGMPLKFLNCGRTEVEDLTPLKGMPLIDLNCSRTPVGDLSPLAGMSLTRLICSQTNIQDLSPLRGMPLEELDCDFDPKRDGPLLRSLTSLVKINSLPAAEFWKNQ